jgi:hypothetical protein
MVCVAHDQGDPDENYDLFVADVFNSILNGVT